MLKTTLTLFVLSLTLYAKTFTFGIIPYKTKDALIKTYQPLVTYLSTQLDAEIQMHIASDYNNMLELIRNNQIDFAILGPFLYVQTKEKLSNVEYLATAVRNIKGKKVGRIKVISLHSIRVIFTQFKH